MVLRNVAKTFSLEEQRQEINEIAADLDSLDTTVSNLNVSNISNWDTAYGWGDHALAGYWVDNATSRSNWDTAYGWGDHGSAGYWVEDSVKITNWDTAYGWGDHAQAGYLTAYTETDPVFTASEAANITSTDTTNWDTAYGWGDHGQAGYLTSYTVVASDLSGISIDALSDVDTSTTAPSTGDVLKWDGSGWTPGTDSGGGGGIALTDFSITTNTAGTAALSYNDSNGVFSYTPPDLSGYLTSETSHADVVVDGDFTSEGLMKRDATSGSYSIVTDNSANWDTSYGWGDHGSAGYLTSVGSISDHTDVTVVSPANGEILTYNGSAWVNSTNLGGSGGSGTLSVTTSNAGKAYVDAVPGTFTAYGVNFNDVQQNTPTYTNTDGTTTVPVTNPANHPDPVSLAFDGREDTYVDVTSTVDGGVVEIVFTNSIAASNLSRLILGFDGNIECGFNGGNYVTASGATGSITELTVTSAGSQTLDKLTFRTPTASSGVGNLYYVIASYPNGFTGGTNSRLTIKQTDISVGSSGTGDNQLIMHDSSSVIQLTPSDVNKVVAVKTDISREIILPAGTLMTPGDTVTVIDVGYGAIDRNDTNNYPQATGAGYPYMTYNSGNAQYAPIKIYPSRDEGIQGTNIQPWNQPNSISNYTQSQTGTGYYVPEPFHGMPFAIKRNGGSIKLMWIGPAYGWRILP